MRLVFNLMGHFNPNSGGVNVLLSHMKLLRELNFNVCVYVYWKEEQQSILKLVENDYEILDLNHLTKDDLVIVCEEFIWVANDLLAPLGIPYIIINQGISGTFYSYNPYELHKKTYDNAVAILSNSLHTTTGLKKIFNLPNDKIYNFRIGVDSNLYYNENVKNKKNIACYLSYKNGNFARFIDVYFRGKYPNWQLIKIENVPKEKTATVFRKSKLFFSFGGPEGFGLPPLESALCGCKVLGFDGYAGSEYFKESIFTKVQFMDYIDFIDKIPSVIENIDHFSSDDLEYIEYLKNFYSLEKTKDSLFKIFNELIDKQQTKSINFILS
jgi:hypothetical protein